MREYLHIALYLGFLCLCLLSMGLGLLLFLWALQDHKVEYFAYSLILIHLVILHIKQNLFNPF